jgi:hypothetical protein
VLLTIGYGGKERGVENGLADRWFESQKKFYVDVGRAFGDNVRTHHDAHTKPMYF